jgi:hypothetical protein
MNTSINTIALTDPIPSHPDLERLKFFAGRHLGEQEFDRIQAYMDRRIAPLLSALQPGIINGLELQLATIGLDEGFTLGSGLALAGNGQALSVYAPLRQTWAQVIGDYIEQTHVLDASGIFYLTLKRTEAYVDADPTIDPCQRSEFDPTRDAQRVFVGTMGLTRLAIEPSAVTTRSQEQIANWVAANNVGAEFLANMKTAVPLGVLAIENTGVDDDGLAIYGVRWFSENAGRYLAKNNNGYHVLLEQTKQAFNRVLQLADNRSVTMSLPEFLEANLTMDFLPAAGELPLELLNNIDTSSPSVNWLPQHIAIDMIAVPEDTADELVERHLPRGVIDLRQPAGDKIRLLLAVNERDYDPKLLDFPQTDTQLEQDSYRYFQRAYTVWQDWMEQFNRLYFVVDDDILEPKDLLALDLPESIAPPQLPQHFYTQLIDESLEELGAATDAIPSVPFYPYSNGRPPFPEFYRNWGLVSGAGSSENVQAPPLIEPQDDGFIIQYAIAQNELESIDNQVRATRSRLEKTRDYLLLQRQQLDNQTVSLAALAGGVAGDGSGLQVARWLPFTELKARAREEAPTEDDLGSDMVDDTINTAVIPPLYTTITPPYFNYGARTAATKTATTDNNNHFFLSTAAKTNSLSASIRADLTGKTFAGPSAKGQFNNLVFSSTLRKTPTIFSTLQFNLNNNRLDKIAEAPKQALTRPSFEAKEFRFGVLEHVRPEIQEYKKALRAMRELITTTTELFDKADANSLRKSLEKIGMPTSLEDLELNRTAESDDEVELAAARIYEALFKISQILTKQIAFVESRYNRIEAQLEGRLRARINKESRLEKLAALIKKTSEALENVDKRRVEILGDYGVVQRLVDDDWLTIHNKNRERSRILTTAVSKLYYVRERQTEVSMNLSDPLPLRYGSTDDIVPGCDWETDPELPEELDDFFETLLEVPMDDWAALKTYQAFIPPYKRLDTIQHLRKTRFQQKASRQFNTLQLSAVSAQPVKASLYHVRIQSQALMAQLANVEFPLAIASSKKRNREVAKVLSLEDIASGVRGPLQRQAQKLSLRLEQVLDCLLGKLNELPPSLRLQWSQLAEDDRLMVNRVDRWPGLERAEKSDFNTTRTIAELVAWCWRQLAPNASSVGSSALSGALRAVVIQSALGDPAEILQGEVQVPPRRLALGEPLRLRLNKPAKPGTVLQLMNPQQVVIALLHVSDDDEKGTVAEITKVTSHYKSDMHITTQYKVVANKMMQYL